MLLWFRWWTHGPDLTALFVGVLMTPGCAMAVACSGVVLFQAGADVTVATKRMHTAAHIAAQYGPAPLLQIVARHARKLEISPVRHCTFVCVGFFRLSVLSGSLVLSA